MPKSAEYWKKRFELLEEAQNRDGVQCYAEIEKQYQQAQKAIEGQMLAWYQRFADNNGVTLADARKMLSAQELAELKWDVQEYIKYGKQNAIDGKWMTELENASAKFHISRLEALKLQTQQQIEVLFGNQLDTIDGAMRSIYKSGYYKTAFEIQEGMGVGWDFATLDDKTIDKVIKKPWAVDGKNFSQRVWGNRQKLVNELNTTLTQNIILGKDPQKAIDDIARKMNTSKVATGRLVMTEEAFFSSAAQKDCFNELDVEQYEIVATLDSHTSDICRDMDGKHFKMSEWDVGTTAPPFHVWCRTTIVPYFGDEFDLIGERAARGADGKTYHVPANMTYHDWERTHVEDTISIETRSEYEKYSQSLGANAPSIEEFQEIKYNKDTYKAFRVYTSSIKSGELTPLADFKLYQSISKEMDDKLVGITTTNGLKITGKSNHSIARVIGSVEQKRSGVQVSDVLDALTNPDSEILPVKEMKNGKSQKFRNKVVEVSVNPDTGNIIQVNPVHTNRRKVKS